ncbi:MAG: hypothetical protein AAF639_12415 [Chloroflexota bacterium]
MQTLAVADVQPSLDNLVKQVVTNDEPVLIQDEQYRTVLISEDMWVAVQQKLEQLELLAIHQSHNNGFKSTSASIFSNNGDGEHVENEKLSTPDWDDWFSSSNKLTQDILNTQNGTSIDTDQLPMTDWQSPSASQKMDWKDWIEGVKRLSQDILDSRNGEPVDIDMILEASKADLESRPV